MESLPGVFLSLSRASGLGKPLTPGLCGQNFVALRLFEGEKVRHRTTEYRVLPRSRCVYHSVKKAHA